MSSIGRNIKKLRLSSGMTQDMLAEKMYVSRQAVSNWETGKNQPDIDTLILLAQVFNTDTSEIIYGVKPAEDDYKKFQRQYIIRVIISAVIIIATIIMEFKYVPYLKELAKFFRGYDNMVFYSLTMRVACAVAIPTVLLSAIALWKDIAIRGKCKALMQCIGFLLIVFNIAYLGNALALFRFGIVIQTPHIISLLLTPFMHSVKALTFVQVYILPFCAGVLLFFGTAKK